MFVTHPKLNCPIVIKDLDTDKEWTLWFYYLQGGKPALAFDAPKSIRIINQAKMPNKKESNHGNEQ